MGIVNFIFVGKAGRGKGVGKELVSCGIKELKKGGCERQIALIRNDNTPSWNLFAKEGFNILQGNRWATHLGVKGILYTFFMMFILMGYSV